MQTERNSFANVNKYEIQPYSAVCQHDSEKWDSNPEFLSMRINKINTHNDLKSTQRWLCDVENEPAEADAVENRTVS